jgi:hypothetical protein
MILPHPESDLRANIMVVGADIIRMIKKNRSEGGYVLIESLLDIFLKKDSSNKRTPDMFLNTLTFLFMMGVLERKGYKIKLIDTEKINKLKFEPKNTKQNHNTLPLFNV